MKKKCLFFAALFATGSVHAATVQPVSVRLVDAEQARLCLPLGIVSDSRIALRYGDKSMQKMFATVMKRAAATGANAAVQRTTAHVNLYTTVLKTYWCGDNPSPLDQP